MESNNIKISIDVDLAMMAIQEKGNIAVMGAVDGDVVCVIAIADALKPEVRHI